MECLLELPKLLLTKFDVYKIKIFNKNKNLKNKKKKLKKSKKKTVIIIIPK